MLTHLSQSFFRIKIQVYIVAGLVCITGLILLLSGCSQAGEPGYAGSNPEQPVSNDGTLEPPLVTGSATIVKGRVTDTLGNPIPEAGVMVAKGTIAVPEIVILTNQNGEYAWNLPAGTFTLKVHKDKFIDKESEVKVEEGKIIVLDFELEK